MNLIDYIDKLGYLKINKIIKLIDKLFKMLNNKILKINFE